MSISGQSEPPAYINNYIRLPHENGGRGPDAFDCYGLMAIVMRNEYGLGVPMMDGVFASETKDRDAWRREMAAIMSDRSLWAPVVAPRPGNAVVLRIGKHECHCGVVTVVKARPVGAPPAGWMLHVHDGIDVTSVEWNGPKWHNRVAGFYRFTGGLI